MRFPLMKRKDAVMRKLNFAPQQWSHLTQRSTRERFDSNDNYCTRTNEHLLTSYAFVPLLTLPEEQKDVMEMTHVASSMNLYEESKRAMEMFREETDSVSYICDSASCDSEDLHETSPGGQQAKSVYIALCDPPYNLR